MASLTIRDDPKASRGALCAAVGVSTAGSGGSFDVNVLVLGIAASVTPAWALLVVVMCDAICWMRLCIVRRELLERSIYEHSIKFLLSVVWIELDTSGRLGSRDCVSDLRAPSHINMTSLVTNRQPLYYASVKYIIIVLKECDDNDIRVNSRYSTAQHKPIIIKFICILTKKKIQLPNVLNSWLVIIIMSHPSVRNK